MHEYSKWRELSEAESTHIYDALKLITLLGISWSEEGNFESEKKKIELFNSMSRKNFLVAKKKVLITGIAGSGKSAVCRELLSMGYEAYGIEDVDGMFAMYQKGTMEIFSDFDNSDPEKIKNCE